MERDENIRNGFELDIKMWLYSLSGMCHDGISEPSCEVNHSEFICWLGVTLGGCQSSSQPG